MRHFHRPAAFTLVEIVLAMGLASTVMLALLGLLTLSFGMLRQSMDTTVETQIVQSLASEVAMLDFSKLKDADGRFRKSFPRAYNDEGLPCHGSSVTAYRVGEPILGDLSMPGNSVDGGTAQMVHLIIEKAGRQDCSKLYAFWVVNNGR